MPYHYSTAHINSTNVRIKTMKRAIFSLFLRIFRHCARNAAESFVARHFFSPAGYRIDPEECACLAAGEKFQLEVNGNRIQCWQWGRGPGILFSHGWNGRGVQFHRFFTPLIRGNFSVIAFDAQAHGASEGKTANYFAFAHTVSALLRQYDRPLQGIVGHSLGASAVINALAKGTRPGLKTVLIAPALDLEKILFGLFDRVGVPESIYRKIVLDLEQQYHCDLHKENPACLLGRLEDEMLIIHDRDDPVVPFADSEHFAGIRHNIRLLPTQGLGHKKILTDETVVARSIAYIRGDSAIK